MERSICDAVVDSTTVEASPSETGTAVFTNSNDMRSSRAVNALSVGNNVAPDSSTDNIDTKTTEMLGGVSEGNDDYDGFRGNRTNRGNWRRNRKSMSHGASASPMSNEGPPTSSSSCSGSVLSPMAPKLKSRWLSRSEQEKGENGTPGWREVADANLELESDMESESVTVPPEPNFIPIDANEYLTERKRSKSAAEARKIPCDCQVVTFEERQSGVVPCGASCINRLLYVECGTRCPNGEFCANKRFKRKEYSKVDRFPAGQKGWGLKSVDGIQKGQFIMEFVAEVLSGGRFRRRVKEYEQNGKLEHAYFVALNADLIMDSTLKGNDARFINHSCEPNAEVQKWTVRGELRIGFFASRNIEPGDEITVDYQYQRFGKNVEICHCGSPKCRGYIGIQNDTAFDMLISPEKVNRLVEKHYRRLSSTSALEDEDGESSTEDEDEDDQQLRNKTSVPFSGKKRGVARKKQASRGAFRDFMLDEEFKQILDLSPLRNGDHMLKLCRLMLNVEQLSLKMQLLKVIQEADQVCWRLLVDYHGLPILGVWMSEICSEQAGPLGATSVENLNLALTICSVLKLLKIPNLDALEKSKVLDILSTKWSKWVQQKPDAHLSYQDKLAVRMVLESIISEISGTSPDFESLEHGALSQFSADLEQSRLKAEIALSAQGLLTKWKGLKRDFKIPKRNIESSSSESSSPARVSSRTTNKAKRAKLLPTEPVWSKWVSKMPNKRQLDGSPFPKSSIPPPPQPGRSYNQPDPRIRKAKKRLRGREAAGHAPDSFNARYGGPRTPPMPPPPADSDVAPWGQSDMEMAMMMASMSQCYPAPPEGWDGPGSGYAPQYPQFGPNYDMYYNMMMMGDPQMMQQMYMDPEQMQEYMNVQMQMQMCSEQQWQMYYDSQQMYPTQGYYQEPEIDPQPEDIPLPMEMEVVDSTSGDDDADPQCPSTSSAGEAGPLSPSSASLRVRKRRWDIKAFGIKGSTDTEDREPKPPKTLAEKRALFEQKVQEEFDDQEFEKCFAEAQSSCVDLMDSTSNSTPGPPYEPLEDVTVSQDGSASLDQVKAQVLTGIPLDSGTLPPPPPILPQGLELPLPCLEPPPKGYKPANIPPMSAQIGGTSSDEEKIAYPAVLQHEPSEGKYYWKDTLTGTLVYEATPEQVKAVLGYDYTVVPSFYYDSRTCLIHECKPSAIGEPAPLPAPKVSSSFASAMMAPLEPPPSLPKLGEVIPTTLPSQSQPVFASSSDVAQPADSRFVASFRAPINPVSNDETLAQISELKQQVLQLQQQLNETRQIGVAKGSVSSSTPTPPPKPIKKASLPPGWKQAKDSDGSVYYYNTQTRETQWTPPSGGTPPEPSPVTTVTPKELSKPKERPKKMDADTSSENGKIVREKFKQELGENVVKLLRPYQKKDCAVGKITTVDDFKYLARKLTHTLYEKECKISKYPDKIKFNKHVFAKARDYIKAYMNRMGPEFFREGHKLTKA